MNILAGILQNVYPLNTRASSRRLIIIQHFAIIRFAFITAEKVCCYKIWSNISQFNISLTVNNCKYLRLLTDQIFKRKIYQFCSLSFNVRTFCHVRRWNMGKKLSRRASIKHNFWLYWECLIMHDLVNIFFASWLKIISERRKTTFCIFGLGWSI